MLFALSLVVVVLVVAFDWAFVPRIKRRIVTTLEVTFEALDERHVVEDRDRAAIGNRIGGREPRNPRDRRERNVIGRPIENAKTLKVVGWIVRRHEGEESHVPTKMAKVGVESPMVESYANGKSPVELRDEAVPDQKETKAKNTVKECKKVVGGSKNPQSLNGDRIYRS
eukprot:Gb_09691 [translate_table: standard]